MDSGRSDVGSRARSGIDRSIRHRWQFPPSALVVHCSIDERRAESERSGQVPSEGDQRVAQSVVATACRLNLSPSITLECLKSDSTDAVWRWRIYRSHRYST